MEMYRQICFRGTDDKLWGINLDGSGGVNLGGYKTKSTPVVFGDSIYFQGTDNKLWKVRQDGTNGVHLGGYDTNSSPFLTGSYIYFQGTDDKLWKVMLDGTRGTNLGGYKTKSTPRVTAGYVYFQGTDDRLFKVNVNNPNGDNTWLGGYKTKSTPFVSNGYVYFQGTDDRLFKVNVNNPNGDNTWLGGYKTMSSPFVSNGYVYFQGTDDKVWRINLDGSHGVNLGGYKSKSAPVVAENFIFFQGTDNKLWRVKLDGTGGVHLGGYDTASTPFIIQPANQPQTGTARPAYQILTVVYAPPGTNGGKSSSSVDYGAGSSTGTTTSTSSSFKAGVDVSTSGGFNLGPVHLGASTDFNYSSTTTDSSSVEIKKSENFDIKVSGPAQDGINHDHDLFYLWLNPMLSVTIDPENNLNWELGVDGPNMIIQYVTVDWLKNPSSMPAGVKQQLDAAKLTPADYRQILSTNPFAFGAKAIDPNRYLPIDQSFPYEPPDNASDPVPTQTYTVQNSVTQTSTHASQVQYGVSITVSAGIKLFEASLKVTGSFEWTNTASSSLSNQSSQSASVTIGGPAFGYTGPTDLDAYWDTVYNSFMFAFPSQTA
jgi:hypothetical protein